LLALGLFTLWVLGLTAPSVPWLTWWKFLFACGFVAVALSTYSEPRRPHVVWSSPQGIEPAPSRLGGESDLLLYDVEAAEGPYRGRGPRGYVRSDQRVREELCEALLWHPALDARDLEVTVTEGVARLGGTVPTRAERRLAEEIAETTLGVSDVKNEISLAERRETGANEPRPRAA
jgi:hypothetical protein